MTEFIPTDEQRRMASIMGLNPNDPTDWPLDEVDRLVYFKNEIPKIFGPEGPGRPSHDWYFQEELQRKWFSKFRYVC